jgi:phage shock protein A
MGFLDAILRLLVWVAAPLTLLVLAIGPRRVAGWCRQFWNWLWMNRMDPEAILTRVVRDQEKRIAALRAALARSETAERDIARNLQKSQENIAGLENEARGYVAKSDDVDARAALYKLNLERRAVEAFQEQLERQRHHVAEARRRLHGLDLQLRQYEVGRSILLSQLAEAKTVEQQFAIAKNFDPFSAVAEWRKAEGMVQEKAITARAVEQVYSDIAEIPLNGQPAQVDPAELEKQLAELKNQQQSGEGPTLEAKGKRAGKHERNGRES